MSTTNTGDPPPAGPGDGPPGLVGATPAATAPDPRSPRPSPPTLADLPPGFMVPPGPPPRPNIGSMLFLTAFFFFMSGNNQIPAPIQVGPDGEFITRVSELDMAREYVQEYTGFLNGTGNWTEPSTPQLLPQDILPLTYSHSSDQSFFTNISGFYRDARLHPVDLLSPSSTHLPHFFHDLTIPNVNASSEWNETLSSGLQGDFPWSHAVKWDMNLKERSPSQSTNYTSSGVEDWTWVKGVASISTAEEEDTIEYNLFGLHHVPNGTYGMWGLPDGMRVDIRHIPVMWGGHENVTRDIILGELEKELQVQEDSLYLVDVKPDDETRTKCPLLVHFTVPPIPRTSSLKEIELYESEMHEPTGIKVSLPRPPNYWEGIGIGGVIVADQCGWAFGMEGGSGVKIDEFWSRSINYAALASASQLLVLLLLVRQIERTRTPSALAKVSLWTIVIMGITDSWVFSAHVVVGIMSDNRTSLPMLVPGFLCLCSAIVFGPRYAVMLHRIQAPERASPRPAAAPPPATTTSASISDSADTPLVVAEGTTPPRPSLLARFRTYTEDHPGVRVLLGIALILIGFQFALMPSIVPFFLCLMYSFWIPQIWRNARRGSNDAMDKTFIIGTALGRLVLPLYVFGYPDNVFFIKSTSWIWSLVIWQSAQITVLLAQRRFGAAFFLPKRFQPAEMYNYHPLLPPPDAENPTTKEDERTCSICMEEVDTRPGPSGEVLLGMNPRRGCALAPCHHLFHTKCLSQWLAIKSICPLCKRSLPPL